MTQEQTVYFTDPTETTHIDLDDGKAWVKIKKQLSIGDQDRLGDLMLQIEMDTSNPNGLSRGERRRQAKASDGSNMNARFKPSTAALLEVAIVAWSFTDPTGAPYPVTRTMIDRLKPEWASLIEEEVDHLNPLGKPITPEPTELTSKDDQQPSEPLT